MGTSFAAWHYVVRFYRKRKQPPTKNEVYQLVDRFVSIFNAHGIERTQIPRFLGEQYLTLADVSSDAKLLHELNEAVLGAACDRFGVQREWLDGKDAPIYPRLFFYKDMDRYIDFLSEVTSKYEDVSGFAFKSPEDDLKNSGKRFPIALIFRAVVGSLGEEPIYKYFIIGDEWPWEYPRTRIQFKAMVFAAFKFKAYIMAYDLPEDEINRLLWGQTFPGPVLDNLHHVTWHPDDYVFTSDESSVAKDPEEAAELRKLIKQSEWVKKLEAATGPITENLTHFKIIE